MIRVISKVREMQGASVAARARGQEVVLVPTMGFLHDGHRELLRRGRALGDLLVLSVFVNPAQFGPKEDLGAYPRDLEGDLKMAAEEGVDIAFVPTAGEMYPEGYQSYVDVEELSRHLCGASRPGHFRGVATVVLKLLNTVLPHKAVFGRKDFQQLRVIERMVEDLDMPVEIIGVETVREGDGLAMSSRNSYLSADERRAASVIPAALKEAREAAAGGERDCRVIVEEVKKIIEKERLAVIDYIKVSSGATLEEIDRIEGDALLFLAVKIGRARLIDNLRLA